MATIWCNGKWLEADQPLVPLHDRGLLHGLGLFETMLAVDGRPAMVKRHQERLVQGAGRLGWTLAECDWEAVMRELLGRNGLSLGKARIRVALSGGCGSLHDLGAGEDRLLCISAAPLGEAPQDLKLALCPWRRNEHSALSGLKCSSYAENLLALDWARRQGLDEVLFLNTAGELCEAATANVFLVHDGVAHTPPLQSGCLPGVMRDLIFELAPTLGHLVEEKALLSKDVESASELFLTNAVHGVMSVTRVGEQNYPEGEVTRRMRKVWQQLIIPR